MAGPFTHFVIADYSRSRTDPQRRGLRQLLDKHYRFIMFGAASPDLPYLSLGLGGKAWADLMHYKKTNSIVVSGFEELRTAWPFKTESEEVILAWLLGYVSHLIADAAIHPIVNATVGEYENHKDEHRLCEMTQDSLLYEEIYHNDIGYAEVSSGLRFCKDSPYFHNVLEFWGRHLRANYPEESENLNISGWFSHYASAIDGAEEASGAIKALSRHIGLGDYFYQTSEELRNEYHDNCVAYYETVRTPAGTGAFRQEGFQRAVNNVVHAWQTLYGSLTFGPVIEQIVLNWNLDTGTDPEGILTFWV